MCHLLWLVPLVFGRARPGAGGARGGPRGGGGGGDGEAARKAPRAAIAANFLARCCSPRRAASRHGWLLGGTHFRCTRGGFGWVPGFTPRWLSISIGGRGAGISFHRRVRPR